MWIQALAIPGVFRVDLEPIHDQRGFFARWFCLDEFAEVGAHLAFVQANTAFSHEPLTLRGVHWQASPHSEFKYVRCLAGAVFDVAVDLRPESPTYRSWVGEELSAGNRRALLIPPGCGHGYLTMLPDCEVVYWTTERYAPGSVSGIRFDDPEIGIEWPESPSVVSDQDRSWPLLARSRRIAE